MKLLGFKINIYLVIAAVALLVIMSGSTTCGCMKTTTLEALTLLSNSDKFVTKFNMNKLEKIPSMINTNHDVSSSSMAMFANNEFSKDCCVNNQSNYYNRNGCVCPTKKQVDLLKTRGNNHK